MRRSIFGAFLCGFAALSAHASEDEVAPAAGPSEIYINVDAQKLYLVKGGLSVMTFPISTSRFGLGDDHRSYKTPIGRFKVSSKQGEDLPMGAVMKGGRFTGEVLPPNAPGRDPIVTRIIRLQGLEEQNRRALSRGIFIHGTPEEKNIGKPVSWGCIRMRSKDVAELYKRVEVGTTVTISVQNAATYKPIATSKRSRERELRRYVVVR